MRTLQNKRDDFTFLEVLADIAYYAGYYKITSGDSRADVSTYIFLAKQFEKQHQNTSWEEVDYILAIDKFTEENILEYLSSTED